MAKGKWSEKEARLEFRRKMFHLIAGSIILILVYFDIINLFWLLVLFIIGFGISYLTKKKRLPFFSKMLEWFERPGAMESFPGRGPLFMVLGFALSLALFPKDVALASIAILTVGDSISHMSGLFGGSMPHPLNISKMLEGTIVGMFAAFLAALLFVNPIEAFMAAFVAMFFEAIEIKIMKRTALDDNLIVPMIAGIVIMLMRRL
ncbi:diacylglycerol/polyprenol kinase family protein [Thermoproteota archaeon]